MSTRRGRKSPRIIAAIALVGVLATSTFVEAMQFPITLQAASKSATLRFAGTVSRITHRYDGSIPLTDITFTNVNMAKSGKTDSALVLSVWGDWNNVMAETPQLDVGQRYIVLAVDRGSRKHGYEPFVGGCQGVFRVVRDSTSGRLLVHDLQGAPVISVSGGHLVLLGTRPSADSTASIQSVFGLAKGFKSADEPAYEVYPRRLDPQTRVSEDEFLSILMRLAQ